MSLPQVVRLTVTSSAALSRFVNPRSTQRCICSHRFFSSYAGKYHSSRRDMQTATAYRPHTLPEVPPPPRNARIPDTSIATDASHNAQNNSYNAFQSADRKPSTSVREGEAQKTTPAPSSESATKPRRSRLRPRKAAMTLTPTAVSQLRSMLSQPDPKMIRVGVKNRGCSGLAYNLEYVDKPGKFDEVVEQDGVKVLIDSKALFSIIGSEMDWHEDKLSQRFVFRNPNIKEQCGCGESFMV
ncbi:iron-sulfur cluster assembly accessory protein Isa1, putative [Talaromyces stipitatus ATCC 10500]|uniref:Iron-sulfur assembly protein 1 n=1 Tax=Talaromyces stipitatus (strain ATCC 10500 / CBS 375.48 / QM 6759 / NRRL 1006) TaxID=441959 RepID=B8LWP8_TALSN|nr:iron-sulfur cluster assembly accessory protein Isa1, putative [Talaromyces stipitatus ATCC 10500]EED24445.1 iron-sulfur cluster assembly accessory protein Isa1, putative [Talaromyces stipitatus ATCC 10500]